MFKKFTTMAITALAVVAINVPIIATVDAKGFSSSRSFSSSSFSRSSYRSSSSSSYKSSGSKSKSSSSRSLFGSYKSKSSSKPKVVASTTKTTSSKFGSGKKASYSTVASGKQTRTAKTSLNSQRNKFKKKAPVMTPKTSSTYKKKYASNSTYYSASRANPNTYHTRRNGYYAGYNAPSYVYMGNPSYGLFDTLFLYSMLNSMNSNTHAGQFAHNYSNDADYRQWRREADVLARDNAELRTQLATMDAQSSKLNGTPVVAGYVPEGVDADLMMSQEALSSMKPNLRVCVGSQSGAYFRVVAGIMAPGINSANMTAVTTKGTGEILANLANGTCDAGMVQGDGYWNYVESHKTDVLPFERVFTPYKEAVHLVCNEKGPKNINALRSSNKVWFPKGSGAAETWKNFVAEDSQYGDIQTVLNNKAMQVSSYEEALLKVSADKNSCAMYVAAPGSTTLMRNIDAGAKASKMVLVDVGDSDLNDTTDPSGNAVYSFKTIDTYKNLRRKAGCFGYCAGDVQSLYMNADFIVSTSWKKANKAAYDKMAVELLGMTPDITAAVKQK